MPGSLTFLPCGTFPQEALHEDTEPRHAAGDRGDHAGALPADVAAGPAPAGLRAELRGPVDGCPAAPGPVWAGPLRTGAAPAARRPVAGPRDHDRGLRLGP